MANFTPKQQAFIDNYTGDGIAAAKAAGYEGDGAVLSVTVNRLLKNAKIVKEIKEKEEKRIAPLVMDRMARQEFWTKMALDPKLKPADRLKASELLAKSNMDFVQKIEMNGKLDTGPQVLIYLPDNGRQPVEAHIESTQPIQIEDKKEGDE